VSARVSRFPISFQELESKLASGHEELMSKITEQMEKHSGVGSEILNSVEDMKQLTSSVPNGLHDLLPKIDKIGAGVAASVAALAKVKRKRHVEMGNK
jgi:phage-related minor tail protein